MHPVLERNVFLVKEHVGIFKAANQYDVYDTGSGQVVLHCREPHLGFFTKLLRFTDYKRMTPFDVRITTPDGIPVLRVRRGVAVFRSRVDVEDETGMRLGGFQQHFWSLGGRFDVLDDRDQPVCTLEGKWSGFEFRFARQGIELAHVTKKWMGMGKELFTSADDYVLEISEDVGRHDPVRPLILGAVMCIDMVLKE